MPSLDLAETAIIDIVATANIIAVIVPNSGTIVVPDMVFREISLSTSGFPETLVLSEKIILPQEEFF